MAEQGGLLALLNSPVGQGILGTIAGGLAGGGRTAAQNAGRGLLSGLGAYNNAQDNILQQQQATQRNKLFDAQIAETQAQAQQRQQANELTQRRSNYFNGLGKVTSPLVGAQPNKATPQSLLALQYSPTEAQTLSGMGDWGRTEVARTIDGTDDLGNKVTRQFDKYGREVGLGVPGYVPPVQVNQGNKISFVRPSAGVSLPVGMSPDAAASNAVAWANNRLARDRLTFDQNQPKGQFDATRGILVDPRTGEAKPVTMDGQPVGGKAHDATEGERKAASLLTRLRGSQQQLQTAIGGDPGATKPGVAAELVRSLPWLGGDTAANLVTPSSRQRVEAAQLDMLDAALTLGTGAAYTKEQLRGYAKSYFPQIGDDAATVADKQARLNNVIQAAEIAAGRAGSSVPVPGGNSGWAIKEVK